MEMDKYIFLIFKKTKTKTHPFLFEINHFGNLGRISYFSRHVDLGWEERGEREGSAKSICPTLAPWGEALVIRWHTARWLFFLLSFCDSHWGVILNYSSGGLRISFLSISLSFFLSFSFLPLSFLPSFLPFFPSFLSLYKIYEYRCQLICLFLAYQRHLRECVPGVPLLLLLFIAELLGLAWPARTKYQKLGGLSTTEI